ncbi:MAG: sodium:solute symporter family protein [Candidatus Nanopelagicales bacterium]|nr:sodium:solute symporter family protein [Candidatus Nanopelagicales bacterium]MDZ4249475.1 sodium:solute symporter family protein [Candidatus Nanopelagicales bacterium]
MITNASAAADTGGALLDMHPVDYSLLIIYFVFVLGIGWVAKRSIKSSKDFFQAGRRLPAWIAGLAFISANLGAIEILGFAANGAQFGLASVHYYWIGAIPAMVFLGIVMMPFYYGTKIRSVPEYLRLRYNRPTHLFNAASFALSALLIAGVNLYSLAIVVVALLGWSLYLSIVVAALLVLTYILAGGLTGAVYNEVMQFFVIIAGLIPLTIVAIAAAGGPDQVIARLADYPDYWSQPWAGTEINGGGDPNPIGDWVGIILGQAFVLSFGYWTTNFAEVQRAMSARNLNSARRAPIIAAIPKMLLPFIIIVPGMIAAMIVPNLGDPADPDRSFTNAIPLLMGQLLPAGVLGVAVTGLIAAFMAGMAANVSSFNAVMTYDIWQAYIVKSRRDRYYLKFGRVVTVVGVFVGIGTALIASEYNNINEYLQTLFSFFQAPVFVTFILGMFWKRTSPWGGFWGLASGTAAAGSIWAFAAMNPDFYRSAFQQAMWMGIVAGAVDLVVTVSVSLRTQPLPDHALVGLVKGTQAVDQPPTGGLSWYRRPAVLGILVLIASVSMYSIFLLI